MQIGISKEIAPNETRIAATPETVKKLLASNAHQVVVETGAGIASYIPDAAFESVGAKIVAKTEAFASDIVLKVRGPQTDELPMFRKGATLIGLLNPFDTAMIEQYTEAGLTAFALEKLPRISRAQSMDVLSSQANIAGYKAVLLAAHEYGRFMPMLMTAAGTVKAARVLILGVGVAGLQAIATAKRLGAVIEASDVRPSVKDQVTSLGAKWLDVPYETDEEREIAEGTGGYARPMPSAWVARQAKIIHEHAQQMDILITTAQIPGRAAPVLIKEETVALMKPGSVIIDLAAEQGGNVAGTKAGETVDVNGVKIIGAVNLPAMVPADASALYARNVLNFLNLMIDTKSGAYTLPEDDEIIQATLLCKGGAPYTPPPQL